MRWGGREPRDWQRDALPVVLRSLNDGVRGVVHAVMGAGKSILIAEAIAARPDDRIIVTAPSVRLVDQLHATIADRLGEEVGRYYTHRHEIRRVTIACVPSVRRLLRTRADWTVWIADEAHRTECASLPADSLPDRRVGFSATPYTSDAGGSLQAFDVEFVRYDADCAIRDGVIVPPVVYPYTGGAQIPPEAPADVALDLVCEHMLRTIDPPGPGLANASTQREAESVAEWLTAIGWPAGCVHSGVAPGERRRIVEAVRTGELRCLVHVAMLVEGVDLPWLRWGLLRRPVASRVRFAQEVGRLLRSAPGKDRAIVLDPHDLFGAHDLAGEAQLGELLEAAAPPAPRPQSSDGGGRTSTEALRPETVEGAVALLRHAHRQLVARGDVERRPTRRWHRRASSARQQALARRLRWAARTVDDQTWSTAIGWASEHADRLTRGDAARLIDVLLYLAKRQRSR